jgi:glycine cleavage system H lipoate-binding protein
MIVRTPLGVGIERCSSPDYVNCPAVKQHHEELPNQSHCPFLQESLAQYCSAATVTKYVPYSESLLSRCSNESHRYCELFLAVTRAHDEKPSGVEENAATAEKENDSSIYEVEGIRMPGDLSYSLNHMWLHVDRDGSYHVGIDAFVAKVLGRVERLSYVTLHGVDRPSAVFTVNGADLQIIFPNRMLLTGTNSYLRANLEKLIADPYRAGWLFEGKDPKGSAHQKDSIPTAGLIRDDNARQWMGEEVQRLSSFVHEELSRQEGVMMDGGSFVDGVALQLNREELLHLCNEFFSPYAYRRLER